MIEGLEMLQADAGAAIAFALVLVAVVSLGRAVHAARNRRKPVFDGAATARLRAMVETRGRSIRNYFFANDAEAAPFDRPTRAWVYRLADPDHGDSTLGAGPPQSEKQAGAILFAAPRAPLGAWERRSTPPLTLGEGWCDEPFLARSIVNIGAMGYGAISRPAVQALARGAALAGCWLDTGDGGVTPYHLDADCDLVMQLTAGRHGVRDADGPLLPARARKLARKVKAFEIKVPRASAGAGAGRHRDAPDATEILDHVVALRALAGRPIGVKAAIDGGWLLNEIAEDVLRRGLEYAPDFLVIDGRDRPVARTPEPAALAIEEALPRAADVLIEAGLRDRVRLVASGKIVTATRAAWALSVGADLVTTARGFMFALGCMQALRCESNTCPTGIATHDPALQRPLVVDEKYLRVANYAMGMNRAIDAIAHECGLAHARLLRREHCRVVQPAGAAAALDALHPYPRSRSTAAVPFAAADLAE